MSGLVKAKKYDWKDSNLELFGSDLERNVKKAAAETETAWKDAGTKVGLQIWRIVKFKVTHWPKEDYGKFYNGDSYIILNTYKKPEEDALYYDVHFWIGQYSTQDEYGTAAYKTVELDTLLDDKPVQHREVMNHESEMFQSYFPCIELLEGGAETGFRHVKPEEYTPRLLHFHGVRKNIAVKEVPLNKHCLDSSDVFILDLGLKIYQWNGETSNKDERIKAVQYVQKLNSERSGRPTVETLESGDSNPDFMKHLSEDPLDKDDEAQDDKFVKSLFRLSDATGKMVFSLMGEGSFSKSLLDPNDVFIVDSGKEVFVWIGSGTTKAERHNAMPFAHNYLMKSSHPLVPVTCLGQGKETKQFNDLFN